MSREVRGRLLALPLLKLTFAMTATCNEQQTESSVSRQAQCHVQYCMPSMALEGHSTPPTPPQIPHNKQKAEENGHGWSDTRDKQERCIRRIPCDWDSCRDQAK